MRNQDSCSDSCLHAALFPAGFLPPATDTEEIRSAMVERHAPAGPFPSEPADVHTVLKVMDVWRVYVNLPSRLNAAPLEFRFSVWAGSNVGVKNMQIE